MRDVKQVLQVIRREFCEMPGLCLTEPQARRLWGLEPNMCRALLAVLVAEEFLLPASDGVFRRRDAHDNAAGTKRSLPRRASRRFRRYQIERAPSTGPALR